MCLLRSSFLLNESLRYSIRYKDPNRQIAFTQIFCTVYREKRMSLGKGPKTAFGCLTALVVCTIGLVLFALRTMDDRDRRAERFAAAFLDVLRAAG